MRKNVKRLWVVGMLAAILLTVAPQTGVKAAPSLEKTKVSEFKIDCAKDTKIDLSWKPIKGASGYEILRYRGTDEKPYMLIKIRGGSVNRYTDTRLRSNYTYRYKIRAFVERKGIEVYGRYSSEVKADTLLRAPQLKTVANRISKKVSLFWNKVGGAKGFEIYRSDKKHGEYVKIASFDKNSLITRYTDKDIKRRKTYFYKVRAFKMEGGQKVYGTFSAAKRVRM